MTSDAPLPTRATADVHAAWAEVVDTLDELVTRQSAALDDATDADFDPKLLFAAPSDLPPLPPAFAERLERIRRSTEELIGRARAASDRVAPRARATARPPAARTTPARFDHRA